MLNQRIKVKEWKEIKLNEVTTDCIIQRIINIIIIIINIIIIIIFSRFKHDQHDMRSTGQYVMRLNQRQNRGNIILKYIIWFNVQWDGIV